MSTGSTSVFVWKARQLLCILYSKYLLSPEALDIDVIWSQVLPC
jgi:hypothetical protein